MMHRLDVPHREWADPRTPADHELAVLLGTAPWQRVVILGDSIAEGIREPLSGYQDRSWADRLGAALELARPAGASVFNLGRRDLTAAQIRARQLEPALALGPDLAILCAGGNDLLRRAFDPEQLADELRALLRPLRAAGADVLTFDLYETDRNPYIPERFAPVMADRVTQLVEVVRAVSAEAGGLHARLRDDPPPDLEAIFARDGLHLNARGHAIVAGDLARRLGAAAAG